MADYKTVTLPFLSRGVDIRTQPDTLQMGEFADATNLISTEEGAVRTRKGLAPTNTTPLSDGTIHTLARLKSTRYAGASTKLYSSPNPFLNYGQIIPGNTWVASTRYQVGDIVKPTTANGHWFRCTLAGTSDTVEPTWPTAPHSVVGDNTTAWIEYNLSGDAMLTADYSIGIGMTPWEIFINSNGMYKDDGNGRTYLLGIEAPDTAPTTTFSDENSQPIEMFDEAAPSSYWTTYDPDGILTLLQDTSWFIQSNASLKSVFSGPGLTTITIHDTLDLTKINGFTATDDDFIQLFGSTFAPELINRLIVRFSIGDTSFTELYEYTFTDITSASPNVWTSLQARRGDFTRMAAPLSTNDWSDVKAIQVLMDVAGSCTLNLNALRFYGSGNIGGSDLLWKYIYRNSTTGTLSNPSPASAALDPTAAPVQQIAFVAVRYSNDPQVDKIDVYRLGTSAQTYRYSGSLDNNPNAQGAIVPYMDNILDLLLTTALESDNGRVPNSVGGAVHNNALFVWGCAGDPANVIRFTKPGYVEQMPAASKLLAGTGGDTVVRCVTQAERLMAATLSTFYQIVGSDANTYQALPTGYGRGMINNPFAMAARPGGIFHMDYDGIYDFPSGQKVSQVIDGVFHGETINGILPINMAAQAAIRMGYFDNKLYVAYPSGSSSTNNAAMVYDVIYNRWFPSIITLSAMNWERDSGLFMGARGGDGYVYQLETGSSDGGTAIPFTLRTGFLDLGLPDQDKTWGDLTLDLDTGGQTVTVQPIFNNGNLLGNAISVSQNGRGQVQIPINSGDATMALNCQLLVTGTVSAVVSLYKSIFRVLVEPARRRTYVTDWDTGGTPVRKRLTTIVLELDTLGSAGINVELRIDGSATTTQTFPAITTTGRQIVYLGVTPDTIAKNWQLKFSQVSDSLTSVFKLYDHKVEFLPQTEAPSIVQTEWTENGYPYDKYWKEVVLDIDTFGLTATVDFQLDGVSAQTFTVSCSGRHLITKALASDHIGKLGRIVITGTATSLYRVQYVTVNEPPDVTHADSYEQSFGTDRFKQVKRLWLTYKAPSAITMTISADERFATTVTIPASTLTTGWVKLPISLPPTVKGKLIRVVLDSASAFKVYWELSLAEVKPMNSQQGYGAYKFSPPQLM